MLNPIFRFLSLLTIIIGCVDRSVTAPELGDPSGNQFIVNQRIFGQPDRKSSVWQIAMTSGSQFEIRGRVDDVPILGRLDTSGNEVWTGPEPNEIRDIRVLPGPVGTISSVTIGGGLDYAGGDQEHHRGYAIAYDPGGVTLDGQYFESDTASLWVNEMAVESVTATQVNIIGVGGAYHDDKLYPYMTRFSFGADSMLVMRSAKILFELPGAFFDEIQIDGSGDIYTSGAISGKAVIWMLSASLNVGWGTEIPPNGGARSDIAELLLVGGNLYAAGEWSVGKEGQKWDAGLLASVALDGQVNWFRKVVLSEFSDRYEDCFTDGIAIYAVGSLSSFRRVNTNRMYGFALLSKVSAQTGDVDYHLKFGDSDYASEFNSIEIIGQRAICVGSTNEALFDYGYQGWFAEVDLAGVTMSNFIPPLVRDFSGFSPSSSTAHEPFGPLP
jgi:hypothetical protein